MFENQPPGYQGVYIGDVSARNTKVFAAELSSMDFQTRFLSGCNRSDRDMISP